jgi:hypothetical protein
MRWFARPSKEIWANADASSITPCAAPFESMPASRRSRTTAANVAPSASPMSSHTTCVSRNVLTSKLASTAASAYHPSCSSMWSKKLIVVAVWPMRGGPRSTATSMRASRVSRVAR